MATFKDDATALSEELEGFITVRKIEFTNKNVGANMMQFTGDRGDLEEMIEKFWGDEAEEYKELIVDDD